MRRRVVVSAAFFLVLEDSGSDIDSHVDGKALSRAEKRLATLAAAAGVTPLLEFFSVSPDEVSDLLGDVDIELPPAQWFSATDGLATVRALASGVRAKPEKGDDALLADLHAMESVLGQAAARGVRWRLVADY